MTPLGLLARSLFWYRRANLAVVLGVATAVAVLGGALVVGDSVRASLRQLALQRLGRVDAAVRAGRFFREALAAGLAGGGVEAAPLIALEGTLADEASGRRAFRVSVYGVDERFWSLQRIADPLAAPAAREALIGPALAEELTSRPGASLLLRVQAGSEVPGSTLYGERDRLGRTLRVSLREVLPAARLGEFALQAGQQGPRVAFVPLRLLQRTLAQEAKVTAVVLAGAKPDSGWLSARLAEAATLEDFGLRLRPLAARNGFSLESASALLSDDVVAAARAAADEQGLEAQPLLTYLANSIRVGAREVPYSLATGVDAASFARLAGAPASDDAIVLNDWAARDLGARPGAPLELAYDLWHEDGRLVSERAAFVVAAVAPLAAGDRDMTPDYPGITESASFSDWDPPFPIDLEKVRPRDEDYWRRYRGTPKAFLPLARAQALWGHRLGKLTALRFRAADAELAGAQQRFAAALSSRLPPERQGFEVMAARQQALAAARGSTDFDEYFLYFSFFLIVSAVLLAALFFRLGVEQRLPEIGLLRAVGFERKAVARQLVGEGLALSVLGSVPGALGAAGFAWLVLWALGRYGVDALGTHALGLHVNPRALVTGALAGVAVATATVALSLRALVRRQPRALLAGEREDVLQRSALRRTSLVVGAGALLLALALAAASAAGRLDASAGFFGSGTLCLVAALGFVRGLLRPGGAAAPARGLIALGWRSAAQRPGRSLLSIALVACASFVIVAVGAFRHGAGDAPSGRQSGTGGYALFGESLLPLYYDPGTPQGRSQLNLTGPGAEALARVSFTRLRLRPGEDASCLNLYRPRSPRVLGAPASFLEQGRFAFAASLAETAEEQANPWLLLERPSRDGTIPAIADQNSIQYVLHKALGDVVELDAPGSGRARLRLVAALRGSLFQSELIVGERPFLRMFPGEGGYRVLLLDAPPESAAAAAGFLESRLEDAGLDLQPAAERLLRYLRVENTYIATFQVLGALGLLLGTLGLATVILRNAAERRRELALLRAVGYRRADLRRLVLAENAALLLLGLLIGGLCAALATWPAAAARGATAPLAEIAALLLAVLAVGLLVSRLAVAAIVRGDVLVALRAD